MIIKISVKNIKNLFLHFKSMAVLLFVSQIIAILTVFFVYGIYNSYRAYLLAMKEAEYTMEAYFESGSQVPTMGELKGCFETVLKETEDRLDYFYIFPAYESTLMNIYNEYKDGKYSYSRTVAKNTKPDKGRMMTDEEVDSGEKVIYGQNIGNVGDTYKIGGTEYEVVGIESFLGHDDSRIIVDISYPACDDNAKLVCIILNFSKLPRMNDYLTFRNTLKKQFGDRVSIKEYKMLDLEQAISYNSVIVFSLAAGLMAALDTCLLYGYILRKRRKQMAVFRLVGLGRIRMFLINEAEIMIISIITAMAGLGIFRLAFEKIITTLYDNNVYTSEIYLRMTGIYLFSIFVITSVMMIIYANSNVMGMIRRSGND